MLDFLFGWSKASKCKKLITRVQCRLKLLKNKRGTIIRQLRDDVAELLRHGHRQIAFDRVEQLFKDESILAVYDLLNHFCEFIIINLSYIRRNKDCPNDINEAISSLVFASARFGDLPELLSIRKLFSSRYGQRFVQTALELCPGNLVNRQVKEKMSIKSVPSDVKNKLMDEIARTCFQTGPLAIEFSSEVHQQLANRKGDNETIKDPKMEDFCTESKKFQTEPDDDDQLTDPYKFKFSGLNQSEIFKVDEESSSQSSVELAKEMVYLDDIEEFESSPIGKDGNSQDQRLFVFKSGNEKLVHPQNVSNGNGKHSGKRMRKRSLSWEKRSMADVECSVYYSCRWEENPPSKQKMRITSTENLPNPGLKEDNLQNGKPNVVQVEEPKQQRQCIINGDGGIKPKPKHNHEPPYLRAMTMPPPERVREDNVVRSNSFPFNGLPSQGHVHPKLPDYDELSAKFMALKTAYLRSKLQ